MEPILKFEHVSKHYIKSFHYDIALTIILLIAAMVIVVDQITGKLRKELLK